MALVALAAVGGCRRAKQALEGPEKPPYQDAMTPLITAKQLPFQRWSNVADFQPSVESFYKSRAYEPAWTHDGRLTEAAKGFLAAFPKADEKGLMPEDYDASRWEARQQWLATKDKNDIARFDVAMTVDTMRYLSDLHSGRVSPQHFNFEIDAQSKRLDLPKFLMDEAIVSSDVPKLLTSVEPDAEGYRRLEEALPKYLEAAKAETSPLPMVGSPIAPGQAYAGEAALEGRLAAEGDGEFAEGRAETRFTAEASDALRSYQQRHGLTADGRLTPATVKSLNVPVADRVRQIDDSLERWRWLPAPYLEPRLMVNLPEFVVRGYSPEHEREFTMRVVSGQMKDEHRTPVFTHMMKYLVFRPYWNVPVDIAKKELVPHMEASPGYLEAKNYETTNRAGKVLAGSSANDVAHGRVLVREKPGPGNSLGLVKFMFPNQYDIYLHSTPAMSLFQRSRRDLSHGCVRVQHADDLAVWVLRGQEAKDHEEWDLDHVHDAMNDEDGNNKTIGLKTQLPIVIFYATANIGDDGKLDFFDDVYEYDAEMDAVLKKGPPYPTKPEPVKPKTKPGDTV